jgi:hypothetical protein
MMSFAETRRWAFSYLRMLASEMAGATVPYSVDLHLYMHLSNLHGQSPPLSEWFNGAWAPFHVEALSTRNSYTVPISEFSCTPAFKGRGRLCTLSRQPPHIDLSNFLPRRWLLSRDPRRLCMTMNTGNCVRTTREKCELLPSSKA